MQKRHASETKPSEKSSTTYRHTWVYDFEGVTVEDLLPDWIKSDVIRRQNLIRTRVSKGKALPFPEGEVLVNVREDLVKRASRVRLEVVDPAEQVRRVFKAGLIEREVAIARIVAMLESK